MDALAQDEEEVRAVIGGALADYFNGGTFLGGFQLEDFDFDAEDFDLR